MTCVLVRCCTQRTLCLIFVWLGGQYGGVVVPIEYLMLVQLKGQYGGIRSILYCNYSLAIYYDIPSRSRAISRYIVGQRIPPPSRQPRLRRPPFVFTPTLPLLRWCFCRVTRVTCFRCECQHPPCYQLRLRCAERLKPNWVVDRNNRWVFFGHYQTCAARRRCGSPARQALGQRDKYKCGVDKCPTP